MGVKIIKYTYEYADSHVTYYYTNVSYNANLQAQAVNNNLFTLKVADYASGRSSIISFTANNIPSQVKLIDFWTNSYQGNQSLMVATNYVYLIISNSLDLWDQDVFLSFFPNLRNSYHDYYGIYDQSLPVSYYMFTNAFTLFDRWNTSHTNSFSLYFTSFVPDIEVVTAMRVLETTGWGDGAYDIMTNAYRIITNARYYTFVKEIKLTYETTNRGNGFFGYFKKAVKYYDFSDINGTPLAFDNFEGSIIKDVAFMKNSTLLKNYINSIKTNLTEDRVFYSKEISKQNYNMLITNSFETIISNYSDILGSLEP